MTNPTSKERAAVLLKAAMTAIQEAGGELPLQDVLKEVEKRIELTEHDRAVYEKSGYVRWQSVLHFYSIDCVKAGFLKKSRGRWYLTPEGQAVLHLTADAILDRASKAYKAWNAERKKAVENGTVEDEIEDEAAERSFVFAEVEAKALQEIEAHVRAMGAYELQDLVAALLRAMGYSTPFVAPKGPDGDTDVLAYPDPLGTKTPHIRVQVKHRQDAKATREEIAALRGIIRQDREIGMFVSTSGFAKPAVQEAQHGTVHIELIDLERLLELWMAHYEKLSEADKGLLRLRSVYLLAPE